MSDYSNSNARSERGRSYGYRHSPRTASRPVNSPAPSSMSNASTSPSLSPRLRSPYQRSDQVSQDSANERWRSWRAPEEPVKTPVQSPTLSTQAWSSPQPPSPRSVSTPLDPTVDDDEEQQQQHSSVAEESVEAADNMENGEPKLESSIWNDDDFDEDEQVELNEPDELPPRSGWTPEPPEPEPKQEAGPIKVIYSFLGNNNNKREARDLSIEDIFCTITPLHQQAALGAGPVLYRGSPDQRRDHHQPSQMSDDTETQWGHQQQQQQQQQQEKRTRSEKRRKSYNQQGLSFADHSSPFMYPQFLGKMSHDHYQQYGNDPQNRGKKHQLDGFSYPEYLSQSVIDTQMSNGYVRIGVLRVNRSNRYDAYVSTNEMDEDIYIGGDLRRNRAFDGDIVAVEFIDINTVWNERKETRRRYAQKSGDAADLDEDESDDDEDDEDDDNETGIKPKFAGKVVGIVQKQKERVFVGYLHIERSASSEDSNACPNDDARLWFQPLDRRAPLFYIPHANAPSDVFDDDEKYKNLLVVAKVISWQPTKTRPVGKIVRVLGQVGDMKVETEAILAEHGISMADYSAEALAAIPSSPYTIPASEIAKRSDFRDTLTFTIDPSTAKDLDDALHCTRLPNGFEVGVHIADVAHFVRPNTPLDSEARERGTSTYLIDTVLPMLPEQLSQDLCSLNPGEDRLTFSVILRMNSEAKVIDTSFCKSIIRSKAKLSYEDAEKVIEGEHLDPSIPRAPEIEEAIRFLHGLASRRRQRRFEQGALALESLKLKFDLDANGDPIAVGPYTSLKSHRLVEEFMLQANVSAAMRISKAFPSESVLRRHRGPILRRMDQFVALAESLGFTIDPESAGTLQRSLSATPDGPVKQALLTLAIRPMQRAKYFCTGTLEKERWSHFALNEAVYTHFTSPIRRYADITVHRQLENALRSRSSSGYSKKTAQSITHHCNYRKERASRAEEQSSHLYLCRYLTLSSSKTILPVTVIDVEVDFIEVYQPTFGLKRRLYVDDMPLNNNIYDASDNTAVWVWKQGIVVDMETHIKRGHRTTKMKRGNGDKEQTSLRPKTRQLRAPPRELVASLVDSKNLTQKFSIFSTLNVRLQVNNHCSPPSIDLYPINPFA